MVNGGIMGINIRVENDPKIKREILESLTALLPEWFGQPDSNLHYAQQAEILSGWVANVDGKDIGLLLVKDQGPLSAEIFWMGVIPEYHRRGIGRALVETACADLVHRGVRFLFVMTLHPDDPYEPYQRTRLFYENLGFTLALTDHGFGQTRDPLAYYVKLLPAQNVDSSN